MNARFVRLLHIYVSAFVAPSLLFFAATGALQVFRLPDRPEAPLVVAKLARLHKDTVFAPKPVRKAPPPGAAARRPEPPKPEPSQATTLLKWFFSMVSVGMILTTLFGLWMGLKHARQKGWVIGLFAAGAVLPVLLVIGA